jgi:hypothetical protein
MTFDGVNSKVNNTGYAACALIENWIKTTNNEYRRRCAACGLIEI